MRLPPLLLLLLSTPALAALPSACLARPVPADDGGGWLLPAALVVYVAGRFAATRRRT